jgi:hypothetical protein
MTRGQAMPRADAVVPRGTSVQIGAGNGLASGDDAPKAAEASRLRRAIRSGRGMTWFRRVSPARAGRADGIGYQGGGIGGRADRRTPHPPGTGAPGLADAGDIGAPGAWPGREIPAGSAAAGILERSPACRGDARTAAVRPRRCGSHPIRWEPGGIVSPAEAGEGGDARRLGLMVHSIMVLWH